MPRMDGTGPQGMGSMTGWGRGPCGGGARRGAAGGRGRGFGRGQGGQGFRHRNRAFWNLPEGNEVPSPDQPTEPGMPGPVVHAASSPADRLQEMDERLQRMEERLERLVKALPEQTKT